MTEIQASTIWPSLWGHLPPTAQIAKATHFPATWLWRLAAGRPRSVSLRVRISPVGNSPTLPFTKTDPSPKSRQLTRRNAATKMNLGKAAPKTTLISNEFPSKISPIRQILTSEKLLHFRISAFSVSALPKWPPFFPQPIFPHLRSGHRLVLKPSPQMQIPGNSHPCKTRSNSRHC
jgi:hypothetical protein